MNNKCIIDNSFVLYSAAYLVFIAILKQINDDACDANGHAR
jgi:hypothetical protein